MSEEVSKVVWDWRNPAPKKSAGRSVAGYVVQLVVMAGIGAAFWWWLKKPAGAYVVWGIAAVLLLGILGCKPVLRAFAAVEKGLVVGIGTAVTWVMLTPIYFIVFSFGRLCQLLAGKDALGRRFDPKAATYWTQHDNRDTAARYQKGY